jgi:hypothetical protein
VQCSFSWMYECPLNMMLHDANESWITMNIPTEQLVNCLLLRPISNYDIKFLTCSTFAMQTHVWPKTLEAASVPTSLGRCSLHKIFINTQLKKWNIMQLSEKQYGLSGIPHLNLSRTVFDFMF